MIDTCQANSMYSKIYSPNVLATGSSKLGENSYSVRLIRDLIKAYSNGGKCSMRMITTLASL